MHALLFLEQMLSIAKVAFGDDLDEDEAFIARLDRGTLLLSCATIVMGKTNCGEHGEEKLFWLGERCGINVSSCGCIIG